MSKSQGNKSWSAAVNHGLNAALGTNVETPMTSTRCRVTHDVPYTLRCVLGVVHPRRDADGAVMHRDKAGTWWPEAME